MNTENLKVGDLLEAIDVCEMYLTMTQTLTIGQLYPINNIYEGNVEIIDDQGDCHDFSIEELLKFFKIPDTKEAQDPKTMTIKEKTKLLKILHKISKQNAIYDFVNTEQKSLANAKIQEILKTI